MFNEELTKFGGLKLTNTSCYNSSIVVRINLKTDCSVKEEIIFILQIYSGAEYRRD